MLFGIWFSFKVALCGARGWTLILTGPFQTWDIPEFSAPTQLRSALAILGGYMTPPMSSAVSSHCIVLKEGL